MSGSAWKFRCPVCGHWCNPADGYGFVCNKRGGCGSEWRDSDLDRNLPEQERAMIDAGRRAASGEHLEMWIDANDGHTFS